MSKSNKKGSLLLARACGGFLLLLAVCALADARATSAEDRIVCRAQVSAVRRAEVAARLREITGWGALDFDEDGVLRFGDAKPAGGSQTARELLSKAARGGNLLLLEDASDSAAVVFSRVVEGRWTKDESKRPPAFVIQIDFADFARLTGDPDALASFNVGWALLHEISHAANDSEDTRRAGALGDCEQLINRMRRECGLAERAEYHFHVFPGTERSEFKTRYVRLAFEQQKPSTNKKRRLWLVWDADRVGGLDWHKQ